MQQLPSALRGCIRVGAGYELDAGTSFSRTEMDVGEARQQPRDPGGPVALRCSMEFSQDQMALFQAWYRYKIRDGADFFEMPLASGNTVAMVEVRFVRGYRPRLMDKGVWMVQCDLEMRTLPLMTEAALNTLLGI